jgi:hypothetical protein
MGGRSHRASGGKAYVHGPEDENEEGVKVSDTDKGADFYAGGTSNTRKEAEQPTGFKKGGKVSAFGRGKMSEGMEKFEEMKKAKKVKKKDGGSCDGDKAMSRLDRPKRASGGKVATGSRSPFSEAEKTSERPDFKGLKDIND